ncbi:GNAT family N-acetyltransferase [uncultured Massilia sp.]|uniref:GNAT family N-acetyltransferase n=1 Tax=uncultured Massilia sp. TaxID=169973 RepID=UPI0025FD063B|nr:GNAT family N-acetyltransferase [uncultured Massilia sp.]
MPKLLEPVAGYGFRLRPITQDDAAFVVELRTALADARYLHPISPDVEPQRQWIAGYEAREGDYYFIVEREKDGYPEGTIGIYDEQDGQAEWGRWILRRNSLAAPASVALAYRYAFETLGLRRLYCRTVADNKPVVSFHASTGLATSQPRMEKLFRLNGVDYDAVEQEVTAATWPAVAKKLAMHASFIERKLG